MAIGLFGKLPARRDFITANVPATFLVPWENWLQAGLAASQDHLGDAWGTAYLSAPAWRFWIGPNVGGEAAVGAFVPSFDGVSRQYPLTLVATGPLAPPAFDERNAWLEAAEGVLRAATRQPQDYAATLADLERLPPPPPGGVEHAGRGPVASQTFWWTAGSSGYLPTGLSCEGLPDPGLFAAMLTGCWVPAAENG